MNNEFETVWKVCGDDIANALSRAFPGVRVYIPKNLRVASATCHSPLLRIGQANAEKLSAFFGGAAIYIPRDPRGRCGRHNAIVAASTSGRGTRDIALSVGCSERLVQLARRENV